MSHFTEMDWNSKWDWESLAAYGSKATESCKKLQLVDWTIIDDEEIDAGSFNLSTGSGNSGASSSDSGRVSSAKSSITASESSTKERMQTPDFRLMTLEDFSGNFSKKMELKGTKVSGNFQPLESSIGSVEPLIGLKLGKRTYFENIGAGGNVKSSSISAMPNPSTASLKKTKSSGQNLPIPRCLVEGCNIDLSTAKEYHRKHRVCDIHSKCPKVIIGGHERRFCQQCSRFHHLSEFDEKKRSCRRRLSDHNARRRKPQQETLQFNSTRLSAPLYGGKQQMSFLLNNAPLVHPRNLANTLWDGTSDSKFTLMRGSPSKSTGDGVSSELHMPGIKLPHLINVQSDSARGLLASKNSMNEALDPGSKGSHSQLCFHSDAAAPEYGRALSLLSSNTWGSCGPESTPFYPTHENNTCVSQPTMMHGIPEGVPLSSSEFWLPPPHQSTHPHAQSLPMTTNFPEIQLCITPYETDLYPNIFN